jgi:Alpha-L-fucosidase C-terminal domain
MEKMPRLHEKKTGTSNRVLLLLPANGLDKEQSNIPAWPGQSQRKAYAPTPIGVIWMSLFSDWLKVNGEGIYATRPRAGLLWTEGDNLRFTRSKDNGIVYCFALDWPGKTLAITSLESTQVSSVEMLGYPEKLDFRWNSTRGLVISIPDGLQQPSNRPGQFAMGVQAFALQLKLLMYSCRKSRCHSISRGVYGSDQT